MVQKLPSTADFADAGAFGIGEMREESMQKLAFHQVFNSNSATNDW